jgi:hypothetical protein
LRGDAVVPTVRDLAKAERAAAALPGQERVLARRLEVTDPAGFTATAARSPGDTHQRPQRRARSWSCGSVPFAVKLTDANVQH